MDCSLFLYLKPKSAMAKKSLKRKTRLLVKNKLVCNDAGNVAKSQLQTIHANISKDLIRNDTMEGRDFIVVPMVMKVRYFTRLKNLKRCPLSGTVNLLLFIIQK